MSSRLGRDEHNAGTASGTAQNTLATKNVADTVEISWAAQTPKRHLLTAMQLCNVRITFCSFSPPGTLLSYVFERARLVSNEGSWRPCSAPSMVGMLLLVLKNGCSLTETYDAIFIEHPFLLL